MIVGAALCPGAPLLIPGLAPELQAVVPGLADSCAAAVASLAGADRIVVITSGSASRRGGAPSSSPSVLHPPGTVVSSASFTDSRTPPHFHGRLAGAGDIASTSPDDELPDAASPGVGVIVGAALLSQADLAIPAIAVELAVLAPGAEADPVDPVLDLLAGLALSADRVALLVIADGSAGRGPGSPGGGHPGAELLDAALAGALAAGSPDALAAAVIDGDEDHGTLLFTAGPALAALAALTVTAPPRRATLLYEEAPLGVGYLVATWSWS